MNNNAHQRPPSALIVGTGRSVLTAATALARHGWRVDVMSRLTIPEILGSAAGLTQISLPTTRQWEQHLGLDLWAHDAPPVTAVRLVLDDGTEPVEIMAPLPGEATAIDSRLIGARWLEMLDDENRSTLHISTCHGQELDILAERFDATVVGGGERNPMRSMFPVVGAASGASDRVVLQAHIQGWDWLGDTTWTGRGEHWAMEMWSLPGAEVMVMPVVSMVPLSPERVSALSSAYIERAIAVPTIAGACVQVLARPGGPLDTLPVERRPHYAGANPDGTRLPDRVPATYPPGAIWQHIQHLAAERVDADLGERLAECTLIPGSELLERVQPQVRDAVTLTGRGRPVVGIGGITRTTEPASGQGAAASTLAGVNLAELLHRQWLSGEPLDERFYREAMATYDQDHGHHTAGFGAMVNAYHNDHDPYHAKVRAMVDAVRSNPELATLWGQGLDQPDRMAPLMAG
ncbi:hypothetical protein ACOQFV_24305 [Nocardiopsis changdeensis]|uniref:Uncharacterized protein n=1 Tax=Nocardiopsis changdeensis TaxID=2831969 RepID=A0A975QCA9_9ACTN|nr:MULTISPECIES: hypothetical protein [Nocardiopsis]QUX26484.1 hypothetical protein KGD84_32825 [Nocardiopsis changdeensis]QYX40756.1 hypothetical protein K1J57_32675 [Nocardiopsis sp. MT53]